MKAKPARYSDFGWVGQLFSPLEMLRAALWALFFELLLKEGRAALYSLLTLPLVLAQCGGAITTNLIVRVVYPLPLTTIEHFGNCSVPVRVFLARLFLGDLYYWPALPGKTPRSIVRLRQIAKYGMPYWGGKYFIRFNGAETCRLLSKLTGVNFIGEVVQG